MNIDSNDPRLTAFVLGELDPTERRRVEALIIESPDCRQAVEEIRLTAQWLSEQLHEESKAHGAAIELNHRQVPETLLKIGPAPLRPWWRLTPAGFKLAAAAVFVAAGLGVVSFLRFQPQPREELNAVAAQSAPRSIAAKADTHKAIRLGEATALKAPAAVAAAPAAMPRRDTYAFRAEPEQMGRTVKSGEEASKRPSRGEAAGRPLADARFEEMAGGERVQLPRLATPRTTNDPSRVEMAGEGQNDQSAKPSASAPAGPAGDAAVPGQQAMLGGQRRSPSLRNIKAGLSQPQSGEELREMTRLSVAPGQRRVRSGQGVEPPPRPRLRGGTNRLKLKRKADQPCSRPARRRRPANQCRAIREIKELRCRP